MGRVPDFTLTNEQGRPFHSASLKGKVWVAAFIYTRCTTSCPLITAQMVQLQKKWEGHSDFALVSISVDPGHDGPAVLLAYARAMGANLSDWSFLSGSPATVFNLI
ncbi:MAG: SCO family protein, partial [bacterium]